eukprot:4928198-Pyramimonas_sp.AAC.1
MPLGAVVERQGGATAGAHRAVADALHKKRESTVSRRLNWVCYESWVRKSIRILLNSRQMM